MKIDKRLYKYIEYELYHYEQYKKDIQLMREEILEGSPMPPDGQPKGSELSNSTESKAIKLNSSVAIMRMEKTVAAIEQTIKRLNDLQKTVFELVYIAGRKDRYKMCDELHISIETFKRCKQTIILSTGTELGIIKS